MTDNKKIYLKDLKDGSVKTSLMVNKRLYKDGNKMLYILSDKSGYINAKIPMKLKLEPGQVIEVEGVKDYVLDVFQVLFIHFPTAFNTLFIVHHICVSCHWKVLTTFQCVNCICCFCSNWFHLFEFLSCFLILEGDSSDHFKSCQVCSFPDNVHQVSDFSFLFRFFLDNFFLHSIS